MSQQVLRDLRVNWLGCLHGCALALVCLTIYRLVFLVSGRLLDFGGRCLVAYAYKASHGAAVTTSASLMLHNAWLHCGRRLHHVGRHADVGSRVALLYIFELHLLQFDDVAAEKEDAALAGE